MSVNNTTNQLTMQIIKALFDSKNAQKDFKTIEMLANFDGMIKLFIFNDVMYILLFLLCSIISFLFMKKINKSTKIDKESKIFFNWLFTAFIIIFISVCFAIVIEIVKLVVFPNEMLILKGISK